MTKVLKYWIFAILFIQIKGGNIPKYECPRRCPFPKSLDFENHSEWDLESRDTKRKVLKKALESTDENAKETVAKDLGDKYCMKCTSGKPFLMMGFGFSIQTAPNADYCVMYDNHTVYKSTTASDERYYNVQVEAVYNEKIKEVCIVLKESRFVRFDLKDVYLMTCRDIEFPKEPTPPWEKPNNGTLISISGPIPAYDCPTKCPVRKLLNFGNAKEWVLIAGMKSEEELRDALHGSGKEASDLGVQQGNAVLSYKFCISCFGTVPFLVMGFGFSIKTAKDTEYCVTYDGETVFSYIAGEEIYHDNKVTAENYRKIYEVCIGSKNSMFFDLKNVYLLACRNKSEEEQKDDICPDPKPPIAPVILLSLSDSYQVGSVAKYGCAEGYEYKKGSTKRKCKINKDKTTASWSGKALKCKEKKKPGSCPALLPGVAGACVNYCSIDFDCANSQKCCSNGCGTECKESVDDGDCRCLDLVFLVDGGLRGRSKFVQSLEFAQSLVNEILSATPCGNHLNVSVVQFCASGRVDIPLSPASSVAINTDTVPQMGRGDDIVAGMEAVFELFSSQEGCTPVVIVFALQDWNTRKEDIPEVAGSLREQVNNNMFCVGVTSDIDSTPICPSPDMKFSLQDIDEVVDDIVEKF